jgi:hypothetical protein
VHESVGCGAIAQHMTVRAGGQSKDVYSHMDLKRFSEKTCDFPSIIYQHLYRAAGAPFVPPAFYWESKGRHNIWVQVGSRFSFTYFLVVRKVNFVRDC